MMALSLGVAQAVRLFAACQIVLDHEQKSNISKFVCFSPNTVCCNLPATFMLKHQRTKDKGESAFSHNWNSNGKNQ